MTVGDYEVTYVPFKMGQIRDLDEMGILNFMVDEVITSVTKDGISIDMGRSLHGRGRGHHSGGLSSFSPSWAQWVTASAVDPEVELPVELSEMIAVYNVATHLHIRPSEAEQLDNWELAVLKVGSTYERARAKGANPGSG